MISDKFKLLNVFQGRETKTGECKHVSTCEMYELLKLSGSLATWKIRYCGADYTACARFNASSAGRPVPKNLLPNGKLLRFTGPGDDS